MGCGCGGKPVNLRTPALPPLIDINAPVAGPRKVKKKMTRADFVQMIQMIRKKK